MFTRRKKAATKRKKRNASDKLFLGGKIARVGSRRRRYFWSYEGLGTSGRKYTRATSKSIARHKRKKRKNPHLALIGANPRRRKRANVRARRRYSTREGTWRARKGSSLADYFAASRPDAIGKSVRRHRKKHKKSSSIFGNPRRKATTTMAKHRRRRKRNSLHGRPRDRKGRLLKVRNKASRRRRTTRAAPRRRRRNRTRVIIKYRTRRVKNVARRRRKSSHRRRSRRRNVALVNPRRRRHTRRRKYNAGARRHRRHTRRRRNALSGLVGRVNFMQVAEVAGGVFLGDKITTYLGNQVNSMIGITDPTTGGLVKTGLGIVTAGLVWRFRPALGLGIAVGAANALLNQYVFGPLWGYATPYLPTGMAGLGEYVPRGWKMDDWLAGAGGAGVAGMGANKLLTKGL